MIRTYQGTVYPWNCDHMNHMNVQFYVEKFDQATWNLFSSLGLTAKYMKENNSGMVALEQNIKYFREVVAGEVLGINSHFLEVYGKKILLKHIMKNLETGIVVSESELLGLYIDTVKRKGIEIPEFVSKKWNEI
ncbi:acyl-CoA thioesterase [Aquimarina litoralis]|uniref:Acyl-CoA thioesterase n=1 Tax=Aquimarina litoralis TaxID=584605 RepID=A0ABP3U720_9FLAO